MAQRPSHPAPADLAERPTSPAPPTGHGGHEGHGGHGGHGDHAALFRDRFWLTLVLTAPVIIWSHHVQALLGYTAPAVPFADLIGPVLGSVIFLYGGWPFLTGGVQEARDRQPGMMLLIAMAITVAYVASMATALGVFDQEVWWELSLLIAIMLLGHWLEMRAIGQAQGALAALTELLPDDVAAIPLAAGVLASVGVVLPMAVGAVLMSLSTVIVALNAQLLRRAPLSPT